MPPDQAKGPDRDSEAKLVRAQSSNPIKTQQPIHHRKRKDPEGLGEEDSEPPSDIDDEENNLQPIRPDLSVTQADDGMVDVEIQTKPEPMPVETIDHLSRIGAIERNGFIYYPTDSQPIPEGAESGNLKHELKVLHNPHLNVLYDPIELQDGNGVYYKPRLLKICTASVENANEPRPPTLGELVEDLPIDWDKEIDAYNKRMKEERKKRMWKEAKDKRMEDEREREKTVWATSKYRMSK